MELSGVLFTLGKIDIETQVYNVVDTIMFGKAPAAAAAAVAAAAAAAVPDKSPPRAAVNKPAAPKRVLGLRGGASPTVNTDGAAATPPNANSVNTEPGTSKAHRPFQASVTCTINGMVVSILPTVTGAMLQQTPAAALELLSASLDNEVR